MRFFISLLSAASFLNSVSSILFAGIPVQSSITFARSESSTLIFSIFLSRSSSSFFSRIRRDFFSASASKSGSSPSSIVFISFSRSDTFFFISCSLESSMLLMLRFAQASSSRSIALSGRYLSLMYLSDKTAHILSSSSLIFTL